MCVSEDLMNDFQIYSEVVDVAMIVMKVWIYDLNLHFIVARFESFKEAM